MTTVRDYISNLNVFQVLGIDADEYNDLKSKRLNESLNTYVEAEYPEIQLACDILRDKMDSIQEKDPSNNIYYDPQGEYEYFRNSSIFTIPADVMRAKVIAARSIKRRHSDTDTSAYNDLVRVLEDAYIYCIRKQYIAEEVDKLHTCFVNDFYKVSSEYILADGDYDDNITIIP